MTHKIAMRRTLADAGVPQPRFAGARDLQSARAALEAVGVPAVLKPADSGGQRGIFYVESEDELDAHLHAALAESPTDEAIVESFHDGLELNGIVIARGGEAFSLTLSDRLRPPGIGFGVGWIHVYPASIYADVLAEAERVAVHAVHALGLRDGIAFPQLIVADDGSVRVVEVAARIPGGQMADLVRHAVGVDLVEVALARRSARRCRTSSSLPRFKQPLAIRFLTAQPGPLPTGKVRSIGPLEPVLAAEGVVQADTYLQVGETIRPVRLDGDRRGYVIATADTSVEALQRPRRRGCWRWRSNELRLRPRPLPRAARGGAGRRLPVRVLRGRAQGRRPDPPPRRRPLARRRVADGRARGGRRRAGDLLPDDAVGLLQPRLVGRRARDRAAARARSPRRPPRRLPARRPGRRFDPVSPGTTRTRVHERADRRARST